MNAMKGKIPYKPLIAVMAGGALEYYDFIIFGLLVPNISNLFFPTEKKFLSLLIGYLAFAVAFFFQPLGAAFFGHIGDRHGRRTALYSCLSLMAAATLLMGTLPTYQAIGIFAPILLIVARILQGFSAGGEIAGGLVFVIEHTDKRYTGFVSGMAWAGISVGILVGSLVGYIFTLPNMPSWAWRIPFIIGFFIALAGLYIRWFLSETPLFTEIKERGEIKKIPLFEGFKCFYKQMFFCTLLVCFTGPAYYLHVIAAPALLVKLFSISESLSKLGNISELLTYVIMLPIFGLCADRFKKASLSKIAINVLLLFTILGVYILYLRPPFNLLWAILYQVSAGAILAFTVTVTNIFLIESFGVHTRCSTYSISHTAGLAVGGMAPFLVTLLVYRNNYLILGICITAMGLLSLLSVYGMEKLSVKKSCNNSF
jgi:MHS family proline/betaine transporter-like MFS transporter